MRVAAASLLCVLLGAAELLPGWPQPVVAPVLPTSAWERVVGGLQHGGPSGWITALRPGSQLWTGDGGALVADDRGLRWVGADGAERVLPPLPGDVLPLGIDAGTASFAQGRAGWLLEPGSEARPRYVAVGDEPLGPALVAGSESLWLTMYRLVHAQDGAVVAHRHGLAAGRGWRLARDAAGRPLVLAPDGRCWALPRYRPGIDDERLGLPVHADATAPRDLRMRIALAGHDWQSAQKLAVGTAERAAVALYAGWPVPAGAQDLAPMPRDPAETAVPEAGWSGGVAPRARPLAAGLAVPAAYDAQRPLADADAAWPDADPPRHTQDGLRLGAQTWLVEDDGERVTATCRDDGSLRWYTRWLPEPGLGAPARFLALVQGRLVVGEGDARLLVLDAGDGRVELDVRPRRLPVLPGRTWPLPGGAVVLHPPGRDDRLGWLTAAGSETDETLPGPAAWVLALPDGRVWLCLRDGRCLSATAPGRWQAISLPAGLVGARDVCLVEGGVAAGGRRWAWRLPAER